MGLAAATIDARLTPSASQPFQFKPQFAAKDFLLALQGFERHAGIAGIEQAIELRTAIVALPGKLPIAVRGPAW